MAYYLVDPTMYVDYEHETDNGVVRHLIDAYPWNAYYGEITNFILIINPGRITYEDNHNAISDPSGVVFFINR